MKRLFQNSKQETSTEDCQAVLMFIHTDTQHHFTQGHKSRNRLLGSLPNCK